MDLYNVNNINSLLLDIDNKKFKIGNKKITDAILNDYRYNDLINFLNSVYVEQGYGFKSIINKFNIKTTYTKLRNIIKFLNIKIHSNVEANDCLRKQRSEISKSNYKNKLGWFKEGVQEKIKNHKTARGIQGYYWNSYKNKYVWLRSSWEFIYAKWLNNNNINWDVEVCKYKLNDGTLYRPDFFIFDENNNIKYIVEIKGYWKNHAYKTNLLHDTFNIKTILIEDMTPYLESTMLNEIKLWKNLRKLKLKE